MCTPAQGFYLPESKEWVPACQLTLGGKLFSTSDEKIAITGLELILQPLTVYAFEEERYHNFFVGTHGILTHNTTLPWQCSVVFSLPFGSEGAVAGGKAGSYFGPVGMVGGTILGGLFCWVAEKRISENKLHHYSSVFDLEVMDAYFKGSKSNNRLTSPIKVDGAVHLMKILTTKISLMTNSMLIRQLSLVVEGKGLRRVFKRDFVRRLSSRVGNTQSML